MALLHLILLSYRDLIPYTNGASLVVSSLEGVSSRSLLVLSSVESLTAVFNKACTYIKNRFWQNILARNVSNTDQKENPVEPDGKTEL
jgi:hypothetical protein